MYRKYYTNYKRYDVIIKDMTLRCLGCDQYTIKLNYTANNYYYCDNCVPKQKCDKCCKHIAMYLVCGCCLKSYETGVNCKICTHHRLPEENKPNEESNKELNEESNKELNEESNKELNEETNEESDEEYEDCEYTEAYFDLQLCDDLYERCICVYCYPITEIECIHSSCGEFSREYWCDPSLYEVDVKGAVDDGL